MKQYGEPKSYNQSIEAHHGFADVVERFLLELNHPIWGVCCSKVGSLNDFTWLNLGLAHKDVIFYL